MWYAMVRFLCDVENRVMEIYSLQWRIEYNVSRENGVHIVNKLCKIKHLLCRPDQLCKCSGKQKKQHLINVHTIYIQISESVQWNEWLY